MSENPTGETYLGDGLYASFEGYQIVLRAPREGGDHWVALEPDAFVRLLRCEGAAPEVREKWRALARGVLAKPA